MPTYTERPAGNYTAKYLGCTDKMLTDKETGEEELRWLWRFQELSDPTTNGEIAKFTGTSLRSANSNAYKMAAGILGHKPQPGDDTEVHIGEVYDLHYNLNQAGNLTIVGVVPAKPARSSADSTVTTVSVDNATTQHALQENDPLPF